MKKIFKVVFSFLAIAFVVMSCGLSAFAAEDMTFIDGCETAVNMLKGYNMYDLYNNYPKRLYARYYSAKNDITALQYFSFDNKSTPILSYNPNTDIYFLYNGAKAKVLKIYKGSASGSGNNDASTAEHSCVAFTLDKSTGKINKAVIINSTANVAYDSTTIYSFSGWAVTSDTLNLEFHINFVPMNIDKVIEDNPDAKITKETFTSMIGTGDKESLNIKDNITVSVTPTLNNNMSNAFDAFRVSVSSMTDCYVVIEIHDNKASLCTSTPDYYQYYWGSGNYNENVSHRIYRHHALLDEKTWDKDNPLSEDGIKSNTFKYDPFIACPANKVTNYDIPLKYVQLSKNTQYYLKVWAITKKQCDNGGANNAYSVFGKYFTLNFDPPAYQAPPWGNGTNIDNNMRDNSGTIIQTGNGSTDLNANLSTFQTLVTQSKGFLGFVKYSMDSILPSWVWLIFGLMISAMVVMRVLGR